VGRIRTDISPTDNADLDLPVATYTQESVRLGWTAALGLEHAFGQNWFARAEVRYSAFGGVTLDLSDPALQPTYGPDTNRTRATLTEGLLGIG
jgi:opacity protein-like surface antigen